MTPLEHLDALITSAYLNDPDDRVYRALMAQRDVEIQQACPPAGAAANQSCMDILNQLSELADLSKPLQMESTVMYPDGPVTRTVTESDYYSSAEVTAALNLPKRKWSPKPPTNPGMATELKQTLKSS